MKKRVGLGVLGMMFLLTACAKQSEMQEVKTEETRQVQEISTEEQSTIKESILEESSSQVDIKTETVLEPETVTVTLDRIGGVIHYDEEQVIAKEEVYGTMRGLTAQELVAEIGPGWNLGNTFDAEGGETAWGNPKTTKEMIDAVAQKGFECIRIPVTWYQYVGNAPDYQIDEKWLQRVEQVVDYALANDMYVIINTHHETSWIKPNKKFIDASEEIFVLLWEQIATHFKEYGDHLIFEGLNEPRVQGSPNEWTGGTREGREAVNRLNESFIKTVRATGGNNEQRLLLVTSYAAATASMALETTYIPEDQYVGYSLHAYIPFDFTYESANGYANWDSEIGRKHLETFFARIDKYLISKNIPVIITEYGAVVKKMPEDATQKNHAEVVKWIDDYLDIAKQYDVPCVWWDNGLYSSGNELFAIFDRRNCTWFREDVANALVKER